MFIRGLFDPSISLQVNHVTENLTQLNRVINYEEKKTITKQPSNQPNIQGCIRGGGMKAQHSWFSKPTKHINRPYISTNQIHKPTKHINQQNISTDQTYQPTKHINRPNISTDQTYQPAKHINRPITYRPT